MKRGTSHQRGINSVRWRFIEAKEFVVVTADVPSTEEGHTGEKGMEPEAEELFTRCFLEEVRILTLELSVDTVEMLESLSLTLPSEVARAMSVMN